MRQRVVALVTVPLLVTGCSFQLGEVTVSKADLEEQVLAKATAEMPGTLADVTCDGELAGEVGATQECRVTDAAGTIGVHVKATEVDGNVVTFELSPFLAADDVATAIRNLATDQEFTIDTLSCEGDLEGVKGASVRCSGTPTDSVGDLNVTVTSVDGRRINFTVKQAG